MRKVEHFSHFSAHIIAENKRTSTMCDIFIKNQLYL